MTDLAASQSELPFYLRGLHAPVEHEVEAFDLPVEGAIPPELSGLYLRNGPNPAHGDPGHWFIGDGMLHAVELRDGRVRSYRNRFVQTRAHRKLARYVDQDGKVDFTASPANTHVVAHAGRILAIAENGVPWQVDRQLETLDYHDFGGRLAGPMTAHPKRCPRTGELHFFGYHFAPPHVVYHRVNRAGELVLSQPIEIPRPIMMHDFSITQDYVLFFDLPLVFSFEAVARGGMPYAFEEAAGARIGVMRRDSPTAGVRWLEIEPCYFFHPLNAWNAGDKIRVDVARYPELWRNTSGHFGSAFLHRYEIDLAEGTVRESALDDLAIEFPRIREDRNSLQSLRLCSRHPRRWRRRGHRPRPLRPRDRQAGSLRREGGMPAERDRVRTRFSRRVRRLFGRRRLATRLSPRSRLRTERVRGLRCDADCSRAGRAGEAAAARAARVSRELDQRRVASSSCQRLQRRASTQKRYCSPALNAR